MFEIGEVGHMPFPTIPCQQPQLFHLIIHPAFTPYSPQEKAAYEKK